ncbi:MAG TPA: CbtB-domain containing protein [Gammaproteobacteria bacterium]|nr:CbtB-domain containing protein [Gammaproteobacteria bacterium]
MAISTAQTRTTLSISSRTGAAITSLTLGLIMLFAVGFAQGANDSIHNAAHDTRHTMVFPCH